MQRSFKLMPGLSVLSKHPLPSAFGLACLLLQPTIVLGAPDPAERRLQEELSEIMKAPELKNAFTGVHVRSFKGDRTLFSRNSSKLFNPASNQKLLTTAAALWNLGPNYHFKTVARRDRKMRNGVVEGNLYIKGYGDPTLTTENLFGFVNDIAMHGIKKINGHVIIDDTFFDQVTEGPGWEQERSDHAYAAPMSALAVNFGTFVVRVQPGERMGDAARVVMWPQVKSIKVASSAFTRAPGSRTRIWVGTTKRPGQNIEVTVRGAIALNNHYGKKVRRRVYAPSRYAGEMIKEMLQMRGIRIRGRVKRGTMPKRGTVHVAAHWSQTLATIVSTLNKYSNNFTAEQILKTLGAEMYEAPGTWDKGNRAIKEFLTSIGIEDGTFVLGNGSGLNDVNRVTPEQITLLLKTMYDRFEVRPEFVSSLAVAGNSGTIVGRFENSPADSRLRAKTGSLTGVSALSGYVVTKNDEILAFSVMMNDYPGRARTMWRIQDRIGIALARYRGTDVVASSQADENGQGRQEGL